MVGDGIRRYHVGRTGKLSPAAAGLVIACGAVLVLGKSRGPADHYLYKNRGGVPLHWNAKTGVPFPPTPPQERPPRGPEREAALFGGLLLCAGVLVPATSFALFRTGFGRCGCRPHTTGVSRPMSANSVNSGRNVMSTRPTAPCRCLAMLISAMPFVSWASGW